MNREGPSGLIPDLTFPGVEFAAMATPWDLTGMLYRGNSGLGVREAAAQIAARSAGPPIMSRLPVVQAFHRFFLGQIASGISKTSVGIAISRARNFVAYVDRVGLPFDMQSVEKTFLHWADCLVHRHQVVKDLSPDSAYQFAASISKILDQVLERSSPLVTATRLKPKRLHRTAVGVKAEKQSLTETFEFGHFLADICGALTVDSIMNRGLPVQIDLRSGGVWLHWCGWHEKHFQRTFEIYEADKSLRIRYPLVNLRIEAELLMFIGQTGINCTQALRMRLSRFQYASHIDGYLVREYKPRRKGPVLFEIFKEYRPHFERYLKWRDELFPDSQMLFPFVRTGGGLESDRPTWRIKKKCPSLGLTFVSPRELRNTRVNWLLRRSSDPDLTAEMAQHTRETLLEVYDRPSQQRAGVEVLRFWSKHDPALSMTTPIAPGKCDGQPEPVKGIPISAPQPDCIRPSGCLWCSHHRDVDDFDYVWALVCFGLLKEYEMNRRHPSQGGQPTAAELSMGRIRAKLKWFAESNPARLAWVEEAHVRVEEGNYHPSWKRLIHQFNSR
ncbi:site-specific integrase [Roseateles puraquae]|uniref:site-specific integrase n=1 Tax=Roseateles puraquae TaxID=431059 RepID=UPI00118471C8|nr:site-specific integrase [Roseateles puraquae]MDG0856200.1 site-specific integrase [Roseateles puraquae]